jgi:hypothetical protein
MEYGSCHGISLVNHFQAEWQGPMQTMNFLRLNFFSIKILGAGGPELGKRNIPEISGNLSAGQGETLRNFLGRGRRARFLLGNPEGFLGVRLWLGMKVFDLAKRQ